MVSQSRTIYRFAGFALDCQERLLEKDGVPLPIGPKVFDALVLLVENRGALVDRPTMRERLWTGQIVEDGTLARVIADLRKTLGDVGDERRFVETVPKFGYRFVAPVVAHVEPPVLTSEQPTPAPTIEQTRSKQTWLVRAAAGMLIIIAAGLGARQMLSHPAVQSILIAPFQVLGSTPETEMLQLGLQDSLVMELGGLSTFAVIKLNPQVADVPEDLAEIGRRRRAGFVLGGTIQVVGGRVQVNARLVRSAAGETVWRQSFEEAIF
jgi:DNA-binding winged helix-turn-helix (wHTH) protein/TolB-like protein